MARIWIERITIPTYEVGKAELSPLFLERRINQGASGRIYPYPYIDRIGDTKFDKEYEAVFLENKYIKIMVLPELGGRVQMGYDKVAQRHFVYHNTVIKPALIGLLGPWVSGGIEFNWPLHHRPTTYQRLDYKIVENEDGSRTLWVCEHEKLFHTRSSVGYTIYPDKAFLKLSVMIYNGTDLPQTFLWWTNIAVRADKDHQHVFPPDVKSVYFHARGDSGRYPVMTGEYCGMDLGAGVDISRNENIPNATSYMALPSKYGFAGAYSHEEHAGILHIAEAGISPGKKLFTWGNSKSSFAHGWWQNLTDSDGPYLELMAGVFSDNQPDFAWLSPYEEKRFDEYFVPYSCLGLVKNASEKGALKCDINNNGIMLGVYATAPSKGWQIVLQIKDSVIFSEKISVSPENIWTQKVNYDGIFEQEDLYVCVRDDNGRTVLDWRPESDKIEPLPKVATQPELPNEVKNIDELFLIGQHIEQYHHATFCPEDYYLEALRRDKTDSRCNLAMGRLLLRRGRFGKAIKYLKTAWNKLTIRNSNPYNGEISYLMGLCYEYLGQWQKAYEHYYKSVWNGPWQSQGFLALARLQTHKANFNKATEFVNNSLAVNGLNRKARHLAVVLARKQGDLKYAEGLINNWLMEDPIDYWMLHEQYMLKKDENLLNDFLGIAHEDNHTFLEIAIDYARLGMNEDAFEVLSLLTEVVDPMVYYHQAFYCREYNILNSNSLIKRAENMPLSPYFPNRLEDIAVLRFAIKTSEGYKANYLLGNLYYDKQQYDLAMDYWNRCAELKSDFAIIHRNLAIGNFNKRNHQSLARKQMEKAVSLDPTNARFVAELDELYINVSMSPKERLEFLEKYIDLIKQRDDLKIDLVSVNNLCGRYKNAFHLMETYTFHPWECKEGIIGGEYVISSIALGVEAMTQKKYDKALSYFEAGMALPDNLGEQKLYSATDNDLKYFAGLACEYKGDTEKAKSYFKNALVCDTKIHPSLSLVSASPPDYIFYRGLSFNKLGDHRSANRCFNQLKEYAAEHIDEEIRFNFVEIGVMTTTIFDEDLSKRNQAYCLYLWALGHIGLGERKKAQRYLKQVLDLNPNHSRASLMMYLLEIQKVL